MKNHLSSTPVLKSFSGEKDTLAVDEWIPSPSEKAAAVDPPDLTGMARWAFRYLLGNPQPPRGHTCRFSISPLDCPPAPGDNHPDPIAIGDTECRMDIEFIYMREMTGETGGGDVEDAISQRIRSYLRDDNLCWCSPQALGEADATPAGMPWTTGHLLRACAERYRLTGDEACKALGKRIVAGLRSLATEQGGVAWYEGGLAAWRDGKWLTQCRDHYPSIVDPLVHYYRVTGDEEALAFAEAMAEGIVAGTQPSLGRYRVQPDGSHGSGNLHLTMRAALGVAEVGAATNNARFVEWARRVYEFNRSYGSDWGWYPENMLKPEMRYWSETCITGDMVEAAIAFAQAGYSEYWDHIERTARNYLREAQFFITPEFENFYRQTHQTRPEDQVEASLRMMRRFEGGFLARLRPNDWVYWRNGRWQINMMGCCPPEGMRALYLAWRDTVIEKNGAVYVNMNLARESAGARVITESVPAGILRVEARQSGTFYLRPPSWAPVQDVSARINGAAVPPQWKRDYVVFENVPSGTLLEVLHPVPKITQTFAVGCERAEEYYQIRWLGNHVEEITPGGANLPIFSNPRRALPPLPAGGMDGGTDISGWKALSLDDWRPDPAAFGYVVS